MPRLRPFPIGTPRISVRVRILAAILLVTAVGMALAGGTAFLVQRDRTLTEIDDRLVSRIEAARFVVTGESTATGGDNTVAALPALPDYATSTLALEAVLSRVVPGRNESSLGIVDGRATYVPGVAIDFHLEEDAGFVDRVVSEVGDGSVRIGTAVSSLGTLRYVATPIEIAGSPEAGAYVTAIDVDAELADVTSSFTTYTIVAVIALAGVGLVGWFVAGRLLRPIRDLRLAASRITASDLHERIPTRGRDDVSELTETVNGMFERLEAAATAQRQLLDDVRHELKTPITIVRGHLELLDVSNVDDVEATRSLAIDELDRMTGLVDDIESLADTHTTTIAHVPVDVADLTNEVFAKANGIAGHEWVLDSAAQVIVVGDAARLTQAWLQLVDNAAKYSGSAPVRLGSTLYSDGVELWVADEGPGIPPGAEERIFERFGRVDEGRGIKGSGLGLPIVHAIAVSHGGHVSLDSSPQGSRFGIVLPLDAPQKEERQ